MRVGITTVLFTVRLIVHNLNPSLYPVLTPSIPAVLSLKTSNQVVFYF